MKNKKLYIIIDHINGEIEQVLGYTEDKKIAKELKKIGFMIVEIKKYENEEKGMKND